MKSFAIAAVLLSTLAGSALAGASAEYHAKHGHAGAQVVRHRRHHVRSNSVASPLMKSKKRKRSCKPKTGSSSTGSSNSPISSSGNSTTSSVSGGGSCPSGTLALGGVCIGMLPDGGSDGGRRDTMADLNGLVSSTGKKHAYYGQYAQATGNNWNGGQLTQVMADLKASGAIFQPAVMPTSGWSGLTSSDNSLAVDICTVMKQFTDEGIQVWLRFAHEVNWYQTDGTYQGNAQDFKEGWATVAAACKQIAPEVLMFFTPNIAALSEYEQYYPDDPSTVDVIGVDYYPGTNDNLDTAFVQNLKAFHDKYCDDSTFFAIGETGLGYAGSATQKLQWFNSITSAKSDMPYLHGAAWFNYQKGYNFKVADPNDASTTAAYVSWLKG